MVRVNGAGVFLKSYEGLGSDKLSERAINRDILRI